MSDGYSVDRPPDKRVKKVEVTTEFVEALFRGDVGIIGNVPDDVTIERLSYNDDQDSMVLILESDEWEEIVEGATIPYHEAFSIGLEWD